eukprot:g20770.t1
MPRLSFVSGHLISKLAKGLVTSILSSTSSGWWSPMLAWFFLGEARAGSCADRPPAIMCVEACNNLSSTWPTCGLRPNPNYLADLNNLLGGTSFPLPFIHPRIYWSRLCLERESAKINAHDDAVQRHSQDRQAFRLSHVSWQSLQGWLYKSKQAGDLPEHLHNWIQCDMPCGYCNTTFMCQPDCPGQSGGCTTAQCGFFRNTAPAPCRTCRCDDDCRGDGVTIPYTCCDDYESTCGGPKITGVWLGKQGRPTTSAPPIPAWDSFAGKNCTTRTSLQCVANATHDYCSAASSTIAGDAYFGFVQKHWSCPPDPGNDCCVYTPQNSNDPIIIKISAAGTGENACDAGTQNTSCLTQVRRLNCTGLPNTCMFRGANYGCYCDSDCVFYGDCCSNYVSVCATQGLNATNATSKDWPTAPSTETVTITGRGFMAGRYAASRPYGTLYFDGNGVNENVTHLVTSWTDNEIVLSQPRGFGSGRRFTVVEAKVPWLNATNPLGNGVIRATTAGDNYTIDYRRPRIAAIVPNSGPTSGRQNGNSIVVTLVGTDFSIGKKVFWRGVQVVPLTWTDSSITLSMPVGTGKVNVTVLADDNGDSFYQDTIQFNYSKPSIDSETVESKLASDTLTIAGANFGQWFDRVEVTIGGSICTILSVNHSQITCAVPMGSETQSLRVTVDGLADESGALFSYAYTSHSVTASISVLPAHSITPSASQAVASSSISTSESVSISTSASSSVMSTPSSSLSTSLFDTSTPSTSITATFPSSPSASQAVASSISTSESVSISTSASSSVMSTPSSSLSASLTPSTSITATFPSSPSASQAVASLSISTSEFVGISTSASSSIMSTPSSSLSASLVDTSTPSTSMTATFSSSPTASASISSSDTPNPSSSPSASLYNTFTTTASMSTSSSNAPSPSSILSASLFDTCTPSASTSRSGFVAIWAFPSVAASPTRSNSMQPACASRKEQDCEACLGMPANAANDSTYLMCIYCHDGPKGGKCISTTGSAQPTKQPLSIAPVLSIYNTICTEAGSKGVTSANFPGWNGNPDSLCWYLDTNSAVSACSPPVLSIAFLVAMTMASFTT